MKSIFIALTLLMCQPFCFSQIERNTHGLVSSTGTISRDVKAIIEKHTAGKQFIFLGESFHQSGADLAYKTKFVTYLVQELGYKNIIFESDFYALYKDKNKRNIYGIWSRARQCDELFEFIQRANVTLWGCDSNLHSTYSRANFTQDLEEGLLNSNVSYSRDFITQTGRILELQFEAKEKLTRTELESYLNELDAIIHSIELTKKSFLLQSLKNLKGCTLTYTAKSDKIGITERDKQMADNLNYLSANFPNTKFIVWAANAHIAKSENSYMNGVTMGSEFLKLNPNNSYHIAFAAIKMPYRKWSKIEKNAKKERNLLHYLPNLNTDYFIDVKQAVNTNSALKNEDYFARLWSASNRDLKTKWLKYFDAIVYIENGEMAEYHK